MREVANTSVSLLRGTSVDAWGDPQDAGTAIMTGIPAFVAETSKTVFDRATQTPRTVRITTCVIPMLVGATTNDQITDERTGTRYAINDVLRPPTLMGAPVAEVLTLRRVTDIAA